MHSSAPSGSWGFCAVAWGRTQRSLTDSAQDSAPSKRSEQQISAKADRDSTLGGDITTAETRSSQAGLATERPSHGTPPDVEWNQPLSGSYKAINLAGIALPLLGLILAVALLWNRGVGATELGILAVGYVVTGLGITVGFHRLFTHRSFRTSHAMRYIFAILGQMAVEGDVLTWAADHRKHHQFSDRAGDPHSPHADFGDGPLESIKGLWHAHTGWLFSEVGRADRDKYAKDLLADRGLRAIAGMFLPLVVASLLLPALVGWLLLGGWYGFLAGLIWGGGVRIFLLHHVTFSINSICHMWGRRRFASDDESRNVWWLSWLSFGESWHNNHHAFPSSAFHGLRSWEIDPGGWVIRGLERSGLAWRVVRIDTKRQSRKLLRART